MASIVEDHHLMGSEGGKMHSTFEPPDNASGSSSRGNLSDTETEKVPTADDDDFGGSDSGRQTPIQNRYRFWYYRKGAQKDRDPSEAYESGIKEVDSFQTVEHFWRIYNHILRADQVPNATDVHLFRDGIKPTWEDPQNAKGGQLLVRLKKGLASRAWEHLVLAIVGEQFDVGNEICGAVVSVRYSEDVISVWNRSASNAEGIEKIRDSLKRLLKIPPFVQVEYRRHQDNLAIGLRGEGSGGFPSASPGFGPRGGPPGAGGSWTRNRGGFRNLGGGDDQHHKDGDRSGAGGGMPAETWARGPPDARDRDRDAPGFRPGGGGIGAYRPSGNWAERRGGDGSGKDYGSGKDFMRDRGDREKDLEKWGKVRKEPGSLRDRDRDASFRDREFRDRDTERDWGRLRRPGAPPGVLGGGINRGGEGEYRRPPGGLSALDRSTSGDDSRSRDWGKLRHAQGHPPSPDKEKRPSDR